MDHKIKYYNIAFEVEILSNWLRDISLAFWYFAEFGSQLPHDGEAFYKADTHGVRSAGALEGRIKHELWN
ncbi:MAG: hypothetical protein ACRCXK_00170 [Wohlfahrtiimonas sp.]